MSRTRPNVIVCLCDQLRSFEVGCYGNEVVKTPNIDRLAESGVRFDIACSNNTLCSPARSILLTGQYSRTCTGTVQNADVFPPGARTRLTDTTLPEAFKAAGYDTAVIGKWHIAPDPALMGFDYSLCPHFRHRYTGQTFYENGGDGFVVDGYTADFELQQLGRYLKSHRDNPFFLYYNISQPHMPLADAPEEYKRMYSREQVPIRKNTIIDGKMAWDEHWFKVYLWDFLYYSHHLPFTEHLPDKFDLRDLITLYYGLTTWTDDQVGALMQMLHENDLTENTIVLFTSDHGDFLGSHHLFNKGSVLEEALRIPMVFHWPAQLKPQVSDSQVISLVDVMPTVLNLAGLPIPDTVQGCDRSQVVRGREQYQGPNHAFIECHRKEIGIRTPTHLYGIHVEGDHRRGDTWQPQSKENHLFYNLPEDPFQLRNLIPDGEETELGEKLCSLLLDWHENTPWHLVHEQG